jgi:salicylate hydroxylase
VSITQHPENSDKDHRGSIRARRTRLQSALLARVPEGLIQFGKKVVSLENLASKGVRLVFEDQTEAVADIVVGADGIHSVRQASSEAVPLLESVANAVPRGR